MNKHVNPTQAKRVFSKGKQTPKPTVDGNNFAKKTDERFYVPTPYPNFNVDCDALFYKSLLVVSAEIISRIFYGAVLNIEVGGMGVTRALCDRFEHRATEKILARFDFLSDFSRPLSDIKVMS